MRISPKHADPWKEARSEPLDRISLQLKHSLEVLSTVAFRHWGHNNTGGLLLLDPLTSADDVRWAAAEERRWLWLYRVADLMGQRYSIDRGRELKAWLKLNYLPSQLRLKANGEKALLLPEDMELETRKRGH